MTQYLVFFDGYQGKKGFIRTHYTFNTIQQAKKCRDTLLRKSNGKNIKNIEICPMEDGVMLKALTEEECTQPSNVMAGQISVFGNEGNNKFVEKDFFNELLGLEDYKD